MGNADAKASVFFMYKSHMVLMMIMIMIFEPLLFSINQQKSLILAKDSSMIILYYCIYMKVRLKNGS